LGQAGRERSDVGVQGLGGRGGGHQPEQGVDVGDGRRSSGRGQQGGRAPCLPQEQRGLLDLGLGHHVPVHHTRPVLLRGKLGGGRDAAGQGCPVFRAGRLRRLL